MYEQICDEYLGYINPKQLSTTLISFTDEECDGCIKPIAVGPNLADEAEAIND